MKKILLLLALVFTLNASLNAEAQVGTINAYGGVCNDVKVVSNYAYVVSNVGLKVFDISDTVAPVKIGAYYLTENSYSIDIVGDYAYIANGYNGLQVINISNPSTPTLVANFNTSGYARDVSIAGDYAYVANRNSGLQVINISNPDTPIHSATLDTVGDASSVTIEENYAYVVESNVGVHIVEISDPTNPTLVQTISISGYISSCSVSGDYAYILNGGDLKIIDISNPHLPMLKSTFSSIQFFENVRFFDNYIYLSGFLSGVTVLDVFNPLSPTEVSSYYHSPYGYNSFDISDNLLAVVKTSSTLEIVNIADKTSPTFLGATVEKLVDTRGVYFSNNYAYLADYNDGLKIIDISTPSAFSFVGALDTDGFSLDVFVLGNYAYIADDTKGLKIIDISTLALPSLSGTFATTGNAKDVQVVGTYAYVTTTTGLQIIDISTASSPFLQGSYAENINNIDIVENYAYVASEGHGLQIINIQNPSNPTISGVYDADNIVHDVKVVSSYAYIIEENSVWGENSLKIINISNPATPTLVGETSLGLNITTLNVVNNFAYIGSNQGLLVFDISNPILPVFTNLFETNNPVNSVDVVGDYAYVANGNSGFASIKIKMKDSDGDGVIDEIDAFLHDATESVDTDGDGIGNNADSDDDGDGVLDIDDDYPLDASLQRRPTELEIFIERFYQIILLRTPDSQGFEYWSSALKSLGKSAADIAKGFILSDEFQARDLSDDEYIAILYRAFFDREFDLDGFNHWKDVLYFGASRAEVLDGFLNSQEFKNLAESYGIIANATPVELFVSRFYKQILDRAPDSDGLADWSNRLNSNTSSASDIAVGFINSQEFTNRTLNNNEYVTTLFAAFFGREPDAGGFANWTNLLASGASRADVLQGFLGSAEFASLASEYGIRVN